MSSQVVRFMNILKKGEMDEFFSAKEDGTFEVTVHTGRMIEAFDLKTSIKSNVVTFITEAFLCAEPKHYATIKGLLDSINGTNKTGCFFINKENRIAFKMQVKLDVMEKLERPFDAVFGGCMIFEKYQESILKALTGQTVICMKMKV